jgi:hypothetical protein
VLKGWAQRRGLDPAAWNFLVTAAPLEPPITIRSTDDVEDVLSGSSRAAALNDDDDNGERSPLKSADYDNRRIELTAAFRGMELPSAIAPLRLFVCTPARYAPPEL